METSGKEFVGLIPNTERPSDKKLLGAVPMLLLKDSFKFRTILTLGALFQILLVTILPYRLAIIPALLAIAHSVITTYLQLIRPGSGPDSTNPYMKDVHVGRTSGQPVLTSMSSLPGGGPIKYPTTPSSSKIIVFHLGVTFNHPLGVLCPGGKEIKTYFDAMVAQMYARRDEYGMLGASGWSSQDRETHNSRLYIFYFKDVEGLHKFAHDKEHAAGWKWLSDFHRDGHHHIAAYHETFEVPRGGWETIYLNSKPTLLGDTVVNVKDGEKEGDGEDKWVRSLVSIDNSVGRGLKSMMARMGGRTAPVHVYDREFERDYE